MNLLLLSLICLILVAATGNFLSLVKNNKATLYISLLPSIYIMIYGIYLTLGPIDLYEDGTKNFFIRNPKEKELPVVFILLRFYQYILIIIGAVFSYLFIKYLRNNKD